MCQTGGGERFWHVTALAGQPMERRARKRKTGGRATPTARFEDWLPRHDSNMRPGD